MLIGDSSWYTTENAWVAPKGTVTVLPGSGETAPSRKLSSPQPVTGLIVSLAWATLLAACMPTTVPTAKLSAMMRPACRRVE